MEQIDQLNLLKFQSILPITYHLFYRLCILSYNVVNNIIFSKLNLHLLRNRSDRFTKSCIAFCKTKKSSRQLTHYLQKILNNF